MIFKGFSSAALQKRPRWPWCCRKQDLPCVRSLGVIRLTATVTKCYDARDFDAAESDEEAPSEKTKQILPQLPVKGRKLGLSAEVRAVHNQLEEVGKEVNEFLAELICK